MGGQTGMWRMGALGLIAVALPGCLDANVERSPRPEPRPEHLGDDRANAREILRPQHRPEDAARMVARGASFDAWVAGFRARARAAGISVQTLERAAPELRYLPATIELDRRQSEFATRIWDYLDGAVTQQRVVQGRRLLAEHAGLLRRIEQSFGVAPEVVVAIWGLESSFGAVRGTTSTLATLATLARDGRRAAFFERELLAALRIVQTGEVTPERMRGSWAGAMGHTQFMPTSYLDHAVDFTGDGRRDIWGDDPADALASAARYLAANGWQRGQPWAVEIRLPEGFDLRLTGSRRGVGDWRALGLVPVRGAELPARGEAELMLPAGRGGPALLAFANYDVLKTYNVSDSYVIALGHLSDRLRGAGPFVAGWPRGDRALNLSERHELQRRLNALGFDTDGIDGRMGPATRAAVRAWQARSGISADGYISVEVLERLRRM